MVWAKITAGVSRAPGVAPVPGPGQLPTARGAARCVVTNASDGRWSTTVRPYSKRSCHTFFGEGLTAGGVNLVLIR